SGDVYFDSVTMFVFLLLGSRYLELGARRKAAGALDRLLQGAAESAWRVAGYPQRREPELVPASQLCTGDVVLIKSGEAVPADCLLLEGEGALDVSLLTGESEPQRVHPGAELPGGAVNRAQPLTARVARPAGESTLAMLTRLAARAGQGKPALALWADKVAGWFVLALLVFAAGVFAVWELHDPARAWPIAVAVLVVSCPCALSLAMPTALAAGTDALLRKGVLVLRAHALETLERTTHVVFDKTGTLTQGRPSVARTFLVGALREDAALQVAAALEQSSAHPLAAAFLAAAPGKVLQARNVAHYAGLGVEGDVGGVRFRLGSVDFVTGIAGEAPGHLPAAGVYLGTDESWLACFLLEDALRPEAAEVVERFRRLGKEVILLSGDSQRAARRVADELGIATAIGGCLPEQKLEVVRSLQREGAVVAMVGDGVNDAAVLHAANVSFALGSGAALAQTHADCVLLSGRLGALADAAAMARRTSRVIRQNLAWATLYNVAAIPAAAFGLLNPWLSGLGMSISSAVVVLNALRLRRV
ncbi:MAG TPA: heavy metal translocating P-type ATPase, partial [Telluria sp.]|nr:heavy metal translocating P-type ATPase [Telluria sp.]